MRLNVKSFLRLFSAFQKLEAERNELKAELLRRKAAEVLARDLGYIALYTAPAPEGPWVFEAKAVGWRGESELSSADARLVATSFAQLADCLALTEPAALVLPGGILDLALGCAHDDAGQIAIRIELVRSLDPDLVVCDLHMPNGGGLKVARACGEDVPIVMLTVSEQERDLLDAVAAGANGYLVKSTPPDELRHELWRAAKGEPVFSPALASLVLGEFRRMAKAAGPVQPLSAREREVLQYVARGHTYREIGEQLFIAEKTVENHVRNILGKLHLNRRQELVRYALEHGIE